MWRPRTEEDLLAALDSGDFTESHVPEAKRELGHSKGDRSELARDLASFAINGGTIFIGVAENKADHSFSLNPVPLSGLMESVEQIGRLRIDPPLTLAIDEIPSSDRSWGYLAVHVEPTITAPHMVDGVYYGRGERTRVRLSDAEVLRFHRAREASADRIRLALERMPAKDPVPAESARHGHLYLVAIPTAARSDIAHELAWDRDALRKLTLNVPLPRDLAEYAPTASDAHFALAGANGTAFTSHHERELYERGGVEVRFEEDGTIEVFVSRLTDNMGRTDENWAVLDGLVVAWTFRLLSYAERVGTSADYSGAWDFGIHGTGLYGLSAYENVKNWRSNASPYRANSYTAVTQGTGAEVRDAPSEVARRLVLRLLRGLRVEHMYTELLNPDSERTA